MIPYSHNKALVPWPFLRTSAADNHVYYWDFEASSDCLVGRSGDFMSACSPGLASSIYNVDSSPGSGQTSVQIFSLGGHFSIQVASVAKSGQGNLNLLVGDLACSFGVVGVVERQGCVPGRTQAHSMVKHGRTAGMPHRRMPGVSAWWPVLQCLCRGGWAIHYR